MTTEVSHLASQFALTDAEAIDREWHGVRVWYQKEENEYIAGTLKSFDWTTKKGVFVNDDDKSQTTVADRLIFSRNPPMLEGTEDLTSLSYLHQPGVLHNLQFRYSKNAMIYTFSGPILIAINPYKRLPIYSQALLTSYTLTKKRTPHVYAIGDQAYRTMRTFEKNQSILVTGESGAGKTETTKILLQYFATKGKKKGKERRDSKKISKDGADAPTEKEQSVEQKVLGSTPILESFGNAKTLRNDNSSRFGKFIIVEFDATGTIIGAQLRTYLLEKSRLTHQAVGERNYHIFYQLCKVVVDQPELFPSTEKWNLLEASQYHFLNTNGSGEGLDFSEDEIENLMSTKDALESIGIDMVTFDQMASLLVAVLNLGNIKFEDDEKDLAQVVEPAEGERDWLGEAAALIGMAKEHLFHALTHKSITAGKETYQVHEDSNASRTSRDSLATFLYDQLFDWLVQRINDSIKATEPSTNFIGILDIYGFESFKINSFEQFCINYANEKLQQQFNQHMFKAEQEEYTKEGIDWTKIEFTDNRGCIMLIEKKMGILSLLDEESRFPKATAESLVRKLTSKNNHNPYFDHPRVAPDHTFHVRHYPEMVEYDASLFLAKNRNVSPNDFLTLFAENGDNVFMKALFDSYVEKRKKAESSKKETVASQFKASLGELMDTIATTEPNYIRCIKPNDKKLPLTFWPGRVLDQLKCGGVIEGIRIARAGYPTRALYKAFVLRYRVVSPLSLQGKISDLLAAEEHKEATQLIVEHTDGMQDLPSKVQYGHTKVFIKAGQLAQMEEIRTAKISRAASILQKHIRSHLVAAKFEAELKAILLTQQLYKSVKAVRLAQYMRVTNATVTLQKYIRAHNAQLITSAMKIQRDGVTTLQQYIRRWAAQQSHARLSAATTLQSQIRSLSVSQHFERVHSAIVFTQSLWRNREPRAQLKNLRVESRQLTNVLGKTKALEDRVVSLQSQLKEKEDSANEWKEKYMQIKVQLSLSEQEIQQLQSQITDAPASSAPTPAPTPMPSTETATPAPSPPSPAPADEGEEVAPSPPMIAPAPSPIKVVDPAASVAALQEKVKLEAELESEQSLRKERENERDELASQLQESKDKLARFQEKAELQSKLSQGSFDERLQHAIDVEVAKVKGESDALLAAERDAMKAAIIAEYTDTIRESIREELKKEMVEDREKRASQVTPKGPRTASDQKFTPTPELANRFTGLFSEPLTLQERQRKASLVRPSSRARGLQRASTVAADSSATGTGGGAGGLLAAPSKRQLKRESTRRGAPGRGNGPDDRSTTGKGPEEIKERDTPVPINPVTSAMEVVRKHSTSGEYAHPTTSPLPLPLPLPMEVKEDPLSLESGIEAGDDGEEEFPGKKLTPRGPVSGRPEERIQEVLLRLSPDPAQQLRLLTSSLLTAYQDRAASENPDEIVSHTSIPRPAFILARFLSTKATPGGQFLEESLNELPKSLDKHIAQSKTLGMLIWFFNVSAVLYRFTSRLSKSNLSQIIAVKINWKDRKQRPVSLVNIPEADVVRSLPYQLQIVFLSVYGRLLRRIMRESHEVLLNHLNSLDYASVSTTAQKIEQMLQQHLTLFQQHCMLSVFSQQFFSHVFRFMDTFIFNQIISRKDLCKFAGAMQMKILMDELVGRLRRSGGEMWFGHIPSLFTHTSQIINCLTLDKMMLGVDTVRNEVCLDMNLNQIHRVCELYQPGEFEDSIPEEVMEAIVDDPDYNSEDIIYLDMDHFHLDTKDIHFVDVVDIAGKELTAEMVDEVLAELDPRRKAARLREAAKKKEQEKGGLFGFKFGWFGGDKK